MSALIARFQKLARSLPVDLAYGHDDIAIAQAMAEGYGLGLKEGAPEIDSLRERLHAALLAAGEEKKLRGMYRGIGFDQGALAMRDVVATVLDEYGEDDYAAIVRALRIGAVPKPQPAIDGSTDQPINGSTENG